MARSKNVRESEKDLKRLTRAELLELLLEQSKELDHLREELDTLREQLEDRQIRIENAGSIAEAALAVSGIFEAAQKAADDYLASIGAYDGYIPQPAQNARGRQYDHEEYSREEYEDVPPVRSAPPRKKRQGEAAGQMRAARQQEEPVRKPARKAAPAETEPAPPKRRKASRPARTAESEVTEGRGRRNAYASMNTAEIPSGLGQLSSSGNGTGAIGSVAEYTDSFTFGGEPYTDSYSYTNGRYSSDNFSGDDEGDIEFFDV